MKSISYLKNLLIDSTSLLLWSPVTLYRCVKFLQIYHRVLCYFLCLTTSLVFHFHFNSKGNSTKEHA